MSWNLTAVEELSENCFLLTSRLSNKHSGRISDMVLFALRYVSLLEVFINDVRYINPRFTYLLTYYTMSFVIGVIISAEGGCVFTSVCLLVCLSVRWITQKVMNTF